MEGGGQWWKPRTRESRMVNGWVNEWMGGWVSGWMGEWMDGWMDWETRRGVTCTHRRTECPSCQPSPKLRGCRSLHRTPPSWGVTGLTLSRALMRFLPPHPPSHILIEVLP